MDSIKHQLDEFTKAARGEAAKKAQSKIEGIKADRGARLTQAKAEIYAQVETYKRRRIQEIHTREGLRVSNRLLESRRGLFAYRQAAAENVRALVSDKIRQFTEQAAYSAHLKTLLIRALSALDQGLAIVVFLRPQDMMHTESLAEHILGMSCVFQAGEFTLGGLVVSCETQAIRIDLSFDTALESAMDHFTELFGMDLA